MRRAKRKEWGGGDKYKQRKDRDVEEDSEKGRGASNTSCKCSIISIGWFTMQSSFK